MKKTTALSFLFLLIPTICLAATGDVLFSCNFEGAGSTPAQVWANCGGGESGSLTTGTISSGSGHDGGKAISFLHPGSVDEVYDPMLTNSINKNEITIVYWERFDIPQSASAIWNTKGIRAWSANGSGYIGGTTTLWGTGDTLIYHLDGGATLNTTSAVNYVEGPPAQDGSATGYCRTTAGSTGGKPFTCTLGRYAGFRWTPGYGTTWHKVRMYIKNPTNAANNSKDGHIKYWVDETLLATITNINGMTTAGSLVGQVSFHPSDGYFGSAGSKPSFHHIYDDITIYEGYVPPTDGGGTFPEPVTLKKPSYTL